MKHKPYPKYKPSGIDWVGDIPEGWEVLPIKRIVEIPVTDGPHETPEILDDGIPFVSAEAVKNEKLDFSKKRGYISLEEHKRFSRKYKPKKGDIYMVKSGATTGNIALVETEEEFSIWSPLAVIRLDSNKMDSMFVFNFMKSKSFFQSVELAWSFGTQQNIGMGVIENLPITIPSLREQKKIADFLDQKTARIDDLIQKKEEMIKLLKEKRAAIINQAVTKGLDPNAKMRSSGIDWIGDIPEGWEVRRLKFIASTKFSNVDKHSKEEEQPVSLCNYVDVYYNDFIDSNMDFMQATATNDEIRKFALSKGDVIVTKDSESWDDIAIPAYVKEDMHGVLCGYHLAIIQANQNMRGEYIFWSFLSQIINYQFQVSATGVTRYGLGKGSLDNAMFFVPSKKEQHQISNYLDKKTTEIDSLIQKIESAIAKLREYRSSLITAAVTGKIDVRG